MLNPARKGGWATDQDGNLELLLRPGNQIQIGEGEVHQVRSLSFTSSPSSGGEDGRGSPFNDH
jgi:hypothetical protein